ncbi:MAG: DNA gyrase inhibitor YacG [Steroidobacteraceae bacterium]
MSPTRVACPTCGRKVDWTPSATFRPFCSERCKLIDLGAWFSGERAIPDTSSDPEDGETAPGREEA